MPYRSYYCKNKNAFQMPKTLIEPENPFFDIDNFSSLSKKILPVTSFSHKVEHLCYKIAQCGSPGKVKKGFLKVILLEFKSIFPYNRTFLLKKLNNWKALKILK